MTGEELRHICGHTFEHSRYSKARQSEKEMISLLNQACTAVKKKKKKQLLVTSERINLFNSIWDTLSQISTAAKIIFADDPARMAIYQLYEGESIAPAAPASPEA